MTANKRIIIPIDSSYKEYKKFEKIFLNTKYWSFIWFFVDSTIDSTNLKTLNIIKLENKSYDLNEFERVFNEIEYDGNFNSFCEVDFAQNWSVYKSKSNHSYALKQKFLEIEHLFSESLEATDIILNNATSHFFQRAIIWIAKSKGIQSISYTQSLIPGKEYVWVEGETFRVIFDKDDIDNQGIEEEFNTITRNIIVGKKKQTYMSVYGRTIYEQLKDIWLIRNRLKLRTFSINRLRYLYEKFIIRRFRAFFWNQNAHSILPESDFFFFPLHMPGEAQTIIRGGQYPDDVELATRIAKIIPENVILVVKEHPGYEGWKELFDLRRLSSLPNIFLIKSTYSSHKIIAKAKAVFTINSSVWFESFAFEKRVFCFGIGAFSHQGVCDEVSDIIEMCNLLNTNKNGKFLIDDKMKENRKKFVANYSKVSFDGNIYKYNDMELKSFGIFITKKIKKVLNA